MSDEKKDRNKLKEVVEAVNEMSSYDLGQITSCIKDVTKTVCLTVVGVIVISHGHNWSKD